MSLKKIEVARLSAGTPVEDTLEDLQKRLVQAEKGASKLTKQLQKYGYRTSKKEPKHPSKDEVSEKSKSGKKGGKEKSQLQKSFDEMTTRVDKMENTLQSLKVDVHGIEAGKSKGKDRIFEEVKDIKEKHENEVKTLEVKLQKATFESEELRKRDRYIQDELQRVINDMKETQEVMLERDARIAELELIVEKLSTQKNEADTQLQREVTLRQSIEDAHDALLMRIHDMEVIVDSERGQVSDLITNWENAKKEAVATKEAFEHEHELRVELEGMLTHQEHDFATMSDKFKQVTEERRLLENDLAQLRHENKTLKQQKELITRSQEQLLKSNESLTKDCQKLQEALKIAATDNKALISQHKDVIQREKDRLNTKLVMQDKMLDNAKEAILKELEREKAAVRNTEKENVELKSIIKSHESKIAEKDQRISMLESKYEADVAQLSSLLEGLRKDKEIVLEDKNGKIFDLQRSIEHLSKENMDYQLTVREMKKEIERLQKIIQKDKTELEQTLNRLNSAEENQLSQKQIEMAFGEIMQAKNKLAYENGILQSKVEQLNFDLKKSEEAKRELEAMKRRQRDLNSQNSLVTKEMQKLKTEIGEKDTEIKKCQGIIGRNEKDLKTVIQAREEALNEAQNLLLHNESMMDQYSKKIESLESQLQISKTDNKRLAESFEAIVTSHSSLQSTLEDLQIALGKKDSEIGLLVDDRNSTQKTVTELQKEMDNLQKKILSLEDADSDELSNVKRSLKAAEKSTSELLVTKKKLERDNEMLKDEVEKLKADIRRKMKQMEEDAEEREVKEQNILTKNWKEKEEIETDYKRHIEKLKSQLKSKEKEMTAWDVEKLDMKRKIKKLKEECHRLRKEADNLTLENKEQANQMEDLQSQVEELQNEVRNAVNLQTQVDLSSRQYEDEIEREKMIRIEAESRCMNLENKEKDLERKLHKATLQSAKASNELKQAQKWFQKKVEELELELETARQTQYILEQTNIEQEKLLESKSEDAKKIVKASRMAVNRLASEVAENLWETKGLRQVVQSERNVATRAAQKYERLMESSARKVEELARELDRAHEKARKAR